MDNENLKEQLEEALRKKELVKPNTIEQRLSQKVESLCDFTCSPTVANHSRGGGDILEDGEVLF